MKMTCWEVIFFVLLIVSPALGSSTAWQRTDGPYGADVNFVVINPSNTQTLYTGTSGHGIFKSTDGGSSWRQLNNVDSTFYWVDCSSVFAAVIDPENAETIYAGSNGGVSKSTDGGSSWTLISNGLPYGAYVQALVLDPGNNRTLYAGTTQGGIFKSTNAGDSWQRVYSYSAYQNLKINALAVSPANSQVIYAAVSGGVLRSVDGGGSWQLVPRALPILGLAIDPRNANNIYAGTDSGGVYKSTDAGGSWQAVNKCLNDYWFPYQTISGFTFDPSDSQTIYANGVYRSTDGGANWQKLNNAPSTASLVIDPSNNQVMYAGTSGVRDGGVFKTTDGGSSWNNKSSGLSDVRVYSLAIDQASGQIMYSATDRGAFKSVDGGSTWRGINSGLGWAWGGTSMTYSVIIDPTNSKTVYIATDGGGVFKSTDGGGSWLPINNGIIGISYGYVPTTSLAIAPTNGQILYAGSQTGDLYSSTDGGGSWKAARCDVNGSVTSLVIDPKNTSTLYAAYDQGGVCKSTDGGTSWIPVNSGLGDHPNASVLAIDTNDSQTIYAGSWGPYWDIYKSTDGGASWKKLVSTNGGQVTALAIDPTNSQILYAGAWYGGVMQSSDGGVTWGGGNTGLNTRVFSLVFDPANKGKLYAGTDGGVFKGVVVPDKPTITGTAAASVTAGGSYSFAPSATDAGSFSISNKPSWAAFDSQTGRLTGTPVSSDAGIYPDIVITVTNAAGSASLPAFSITVALPSYNLAVAGVGSGKGTVTSSTGGIACITGSSDACGASYTLGATVTLYVTPDSNSTFGGWSGACQGTGVCSISMTSDRSVSATFVAAPKAKIGSVAYDTLLSAITAAGDGATILAREVVFPENLIFSKAGKAALIGGYDAGFSANSSFFSSIDGSLRIRSGRLTVRNLSVR